MPSHFPGMDPYMEAPDLWEDVYVSLMTRIRAQLTQRLPEGFRARVEKWVRPILVQAWQQEPLQRFIEIVAIGKPDRIITVIEILSHANKVGRGQEAYQHKQQLLVQSGTSLLEIDLLRAGSYTVAAPLTEEIPPLPYRVSLHRAGQLEQFEVWPISLRTPLPEVRIPLTPDRPDIYLDLQEALNEAYDEGNYAAEIDYTRPPIPALAPHDMSWMESFLTKA
nr:DUF4058 family protein [Armatimonas sp.]